MGAVYRGEGVPIFLNAIRTMEKSVGEKGVGRFLQRTYSKFHWASAEKATGEQVNRGFL